MGYSLLARLAAVELLRRATKSDILDRRRAEEEGAFVGGGGAGGVAAAVDAIITVVSVYEI